MPALYNTRALSTPHEKGLALESAVAAIEAMILKASPAAKDKPYLIESRKLIDADGVRHEIDLYVTTNIAPGYQAVFIFECKNWQEAVNKNEVIIFAEKIKACNAQHGFFVAKSFTEDAEAQSKKEPRMTLRIVTERDPASTVLPFGFFTVFLNAKGVKAHFHKWGTSSRTALFDPTQVTVTLDGKPLDFAAYMNQWVQEAMNENVKAFPAVTTAAGVYERECESRRFFDEGRLVVSGTNIREAEIKVRYEITLVRPAVKSDFEVGGRGRVVTLEGHAVGGVAIDLIQVTFDSASSGA